MKFLIKIWLLSILISATCSAQNLENSSNKKRVFLLAGQSNMDGRADGGLLSAIDLKRLSRVANRIEFYYNHEKVTPLKLTQANDYIKKKFKLTECFGPELFFGIALAEKYPNEKFIFIKRSIGGTSLYGCWNPDWSADKAKLMNELDRPKLFSDFINYVTEVLKSYPKDAYKIEGMLWVQGEADSGVKKWGEKPADSYEQNLRNLITRTRDLLQVPDMPFVMFQVGSGKVVEGMQNVSKTDKNVYLIPQSADKNSPDYYPRNPPPLGHYITPSMKRIGVQFFKVFNTFLQ